LTSGVGWQANVSELEKALVERALRQAQGNKSKAAEAGFSTRQCANSVSINASGATGRVGKSERERRERRESQSIEGEIRGSPAR
jgi:Bacterial regulatory protein, Fis family